MIEHFLFGGTSAMVARTLTAPLELKKLQLQNNYLKQQSIKNVLRNEGIRFLWKGNMTNCVRVFPQYAINFMSFEKFQNMYSNFYDNKVLTNLLAGGTSGVISMTATYPLETARTHLSLQVNKSKYNSLFDVFKKLNTRQLYAGLRMSMFGFAPWNAINFASYNKYKDIFKQYESNKNLYKLLCGGTAGITAITVTYPTDLIRKRLQMQSFSFDVPRYNGIIDCVYKIIKTDGFFGLYNGLSISYIKTFPTLAIQFWCYDTLKDFFIKK
tara:strand:- start:9250 stop:10056 length:807 start_codon:yes stop_codon:yes gene_type:complete